MDELVAICPHSIMPLYHVNGWIFVIGVINGIPPFRCFPAHDFTERFALHILGNLNPCIIQKSRSKIDILYHGIDLGAWLYLFGIGHHQGRTQRFLVHKALVEPAVLPHIKTLVRGVDHNRVVIQSIFFQVVKDLSHALVYRGNASQIVLHVPLVPPAHHLFLVHGRTSFLKIF